MIIYDYANHPVEIILPEKVISRIDVDVITGDETGTVHFADGTELDFDASEDRMMDYYDGCYSVSGENVGKWLSFEPSYKKTVSYERQEIFEDME